MPTITTRVQRLLKRTDRMRQQAVRTLQRTLRQIDRERKQRTADLEEAAKVVLKQLAEMGQVAVDRSTAKAKKTTTATGSFAKGKKRRIRRSSEQLKAEATRVLELIRKAGKDGMGGAEIRKSFPGVGQNIKDFVEKNTGAKLKTTGQRVKMRYHAA